VRRMLQFVSHGPTRDAASSCSQSCGAKKKGGGNGGEPSGTVSWSHSDVVLSLYIYIYV